MKKIFKGINIVMIVVLIALAIGVSYIALPFFGNQALIVRSGSMTPTIDVGSVAVVRKASNYKVGDVIAFRSEKNPKSITTHRIVGIQPLNNGAAYRTRGDANNTDDIALVSDENVLGKTFMVIPYVGKILAFAKSDIGFPALIIFPAIIVILLEAFSIFKEIKKKRKLSKGFGFVNFDLKKPHNKSMLGFKLLIPLIAFSLIVPSTFAFFSDSSTSTGNLFSSAETFPQQCEDGTAYATSVTDSFQGTKKDGSPITDPNRTDPDKILGAPDWTDGGSTGFFSLGKDGFITVMFDFPISTSVDLKIFEATSGRASYPEESATVSASLDGNTYTDLGPVSSEPGGDGINEITLPSLTKFVRVFDNTNFGPHNNNADGFDIDSLEGEIVCDEI